MLRDEEEILRVTRELVASGMGEEGLRLFRAVAGKPDDVSAWRHMSEYARRFREQYERTLKEEANESASDEALDLVDAAEHLLMKMPAPNLEALQWKLAWMRRELAVDGELTEQFEALQNDVLRFAKQPDTQ